MTFMSLLRELVGMFQYLSADEVVSRMNASASAVHFQLQLIELYIADARGLSAHWNQFYPAYYRLVSEFARTWGQDRVAQIRDHYNAHPDARQVKPRPDSRFRCVLCTYVCT